MPAIVLDTGDTATNQTKIPAVLCLILVREAGVEEGRQIIRRMRNNYFRQLGILYSK